MPRGKKALSNSALIKRKLEEPNMEESAYEWPPFNFEELQTTKRKLTNSAEIIASKENPIVISEEDGGLLKDMTCPVCNTVIKNADENIMDKHVDYCLSSGLLAEEEKLQQEQIHIPKIPKKVEKNEDERIGVIVPQEDEDEENEEQEEEEEESPPTVCNVCGNAFYGFSCAVCAMNAKKKKKAPPKRKPVSKRWQNAMKNTNFMICAYPSCAQNSEMFSRNSYSLHVMTQHATDAHQAIVCPICPQIDYQVHPGTNLFKHIMEFHAAGAAVNEKIPADHELNFAEEILQRDIDQECSICFEPFVKGACIARLKCFCIFHKHCHQECIKHNKLHSQTGCPLHECLDPE